MTNYIENYKTINHQYHNEIFHIAYIISNEQYKKNKTYKNLKVNNKDNINIIIYIKTNNIEDFLLKLKSFLEQKKENKLIYNRNKKTAIVLDDQYDEYFLIESLKTKEIPFKQLLEIVEEIKFDLVI